MAQNKKGLAYINHRYNTNYVIGMRLLIAGQYGQLRGGRDGNLTILFDGDKTLSQVHPSFQVELIKSIHSA